MFFCWGTKPDKDEFSYAWYCQTQPLRKAQKHDDHLRPVCPVVGPPTPGGSNVPPPDRRRRDHATEQPHVSRAARSGSDSPFRDGTHHIQYQRSNIYSSCAETGSLSRRASPDFYDGIPMSSPGCSQEDVFVSRREHSRPEHFPTGYRGEEGHEETGRPSAGYRPSMNHPHQSVVQGFSPYRFILRGFGTRLDLNLGLDLNVGENENENEVIPDLLVKRTLGLHGQDNIIRNTSTAMRDLHALSGCSLSDRDPDLRAQDACHDLVLVSSSSSRRRPSGQCFT
ncbi:hypothetical protein N8T08_006341 [Aspergillus melleus]|uniref:Uncharacterized protein n=1 Tax=Aspergillus melleus TaxID=138277 RepID=A0ACC3B0I7_9EURO|nr:hypothetical protein N8T08_006341 [Aspergillus melleus]